MWTYRHEKILSDLTAEEITEEDVQVKTKKHPHRGRTLHKELPRKNILFTLPENKCKCPECKATNFCKLP